MIVRFLRSITGLLVVAVAVSVTSPVVWAEQDEFTVSEYTYRRLDRAQKALEAKKYNEALSALKELEARSSINNYERALMLQTRAYVHVARKDFPKAVVSLQAAAKLEALPKASQTELYFNLGQLLSSLERPKEALVAFRQWTKRVEKATPDALYTVGVVYAQDKNFKTALKFVDPAIRGKGKKTPTAWLQLKLACHVQLRQFSAAIPVMQDLVEREWTKVQLWKQLSALYAEAGKVAESVAVLEAAYWNHILVEEEDIVLLAQNLMAIDVPIKAAKILEDGLSRKLFSRNAKLLELIGTGYVAAAEGAQAVGSLSEAAKRSKSSRLYVEAGRILLDEKAYADALTAFRKALELGGTKQPGQIHVMAGIAQVKLKRLPGAKRSFLAASKYEDSRGSARSWLAFLEASNR